MSLFANDSIASNDDRTRRARIVFEEYQKLTDANDKWAAVSETRRRDFWYPLADKIYEKFNEN